MKYKMSLAAAAACFFTAFLLLASCRLKQGEELAGRIAPQILRFHVLAESSQTSDQQRKLGVKGLVLEYIQKNAPDNADKAELSRWILTQKAPIEAMSGKWLAEHGSDAPVVLSLSRDYFPSKAYGQMVFPAGTYDALRIVIGSGKGKNWWCVLYPSLCFTDAVHADLPEVSKNRLKVMVSEEDFDSLLPRFSGEKKPEIRVRFRLAELFTDKR